MVRNMLHQSGEIITTKVNQPYMPNWQHRDGNPNKSQWVISEAGR